MCLLWFVCIAIVRHWSLSGFVSIDLRVLECSNVAQPWLRDVLNWLFWIVVTLWVLVRVFDLLGTGGIRETKAPSDRDSCQPAIVAVLVAMIVISAWIGTPGRFEEIAIADIDGASYALIGRGLGIDYDYVLVQVENRGVFVYSIRALDEVPGAWSEECFGAVIRPRRASDVRRAIERTRVGGVAVLIDGNRCVILWHPGGMSAVNVQDINPFEFIQGDETGTIDDLESILLSIRRVSSTVSPMERYAITHPLADPSISLSVSVRSGIPVESVLTSEVTTRNPWVGDAVRRIITAGGAAMYPVAILKYR